MEWKAKNGLKVEYAKTAIDDSTTELRERSFARKSQDYSLWSHIRSPPSFFRQAFPVFLNFQTLPVSQPFRGRLTQDSLFYPIQCLLAAAFWS